VLLRELVASLLSTDGVPFPPCLILLPFFWVVLVIRVSAVSFVVPGSRGSVLAGLRGLPEILGG